MPKITPDNKIVNKPKEKKPIAQIRQEYQELQDKYDKLLDGAYCHMCQKFKSKTQFYTSYDPRIKSGCTFICKQCAEDIAMRRDPLGNLHDPTKDSVKTALKYLNKPFLDTVWDSAVAEVANPSAPCKDVWSAYIKGIAKPQYRSLLWEHSDMFKGEFIPTYKYPDEINEEYKELNKADEEYRQNRDNVISLIGYDPFANYPKEVDKPMLYSSLASFIDEETIQDPMKMKAVIQIVKSLNQAEKINDQLDSIVQEDIRQPAVIAAIEDLSTSVQKLMAVVGALAKDNGISVNNNKNKSKGASTLSGRIKQLDAIGFRSSKINAFDYGTCMGMKQVAELSEEARHKQIGYDENIAQEIKDIKVELVENLQRELDEAQESVRLLLVENLDLKAVMQEKGIMDEDGQLI